MAEMGLGVERPLNKEKRTWINKLKERRCLGSYTGHANKRFRILPADRRVAQGTGRYSTQKKNNKCDCNYQPT